jgi:hypothetical protein
LLALDPKEWKVRCLFIYYAFISDDQAETRPLYRPRPFTSAI